MKPTTKRPTVQFRVVNKPVRANGPIRPSCQVGDVH